MQNGNPLVTAVIPTHNRPDLVRRAVRSALAQTYTNIEVIVVLDGPDEATVSALQDIQALDGRLRILPLPQSVGANDTRNAGIKAAKGEWIALLDDDDEWLPEKLEKQIAAGLNSSHKLPVISCKYVWRSSDVDDIWPRKQPTLPIADYIALRTEISAGQAGLQTSTLVARTSLFLSSPFTSGLRKFQDWDWLIRAFDLQGVGLEFVSEPLSVWHIGEGRETITGTCDWRSPLDWANKMRSHFAPESYASFLLVNLGQTASTHRDWSAFIPLLASAIRKGRPQPVHLALYFSRWVIPHNVRSILRTTLQSLSKPSFGRNSMIT